MATEAVVPTEMPVPFTIRLRMSATMCSAMKKKSVGGMSASISSLTFSDILLMASPPAGGGRKRDCAAATARHQRR